MGQPTQVLRRPHGKEFDRAEPLSGLRRQAREKLIEPFEPGQVKTNGAGERLISYGTSSYGYDVR